MKDSFILYTDYADQLELLSMEQRGQLFTAIMAYATEDESPTMDAVVEMAFSFIKARMKRDDEKYQEVIEKRKEAGRISAESRKNSSEHMSTHVNTCQHMSTSVNTSQQTSTQVNTEEQTSTNSTDNVHVHEHVHDNKKHKYIKPTLDEVKAYCEERHSNVDAESFIAYYDSQNWKKANGQPLSNWKSAIITWEKKARGAPKRNQFNNFPQRDYNDEFYENIEKMLLG